MSSFDESNKSDGYTTVRLPNELMEEIDQIIKHRIRGYRSRSEFIKEAVRKSLEELHTSTNFSDSLDS